MESASLRASIPSLRLDRLSGIEGDGSNSYTHSAEKGEGLLIQPFGDNVNVFVFAGEFLKLNRHLLNFCSIKHRPSLRKFFSTEDWR